MPNLSGGGQNQILFMPWDTETSLRTPAAIPAVNPLTFFTSQAVMRDANGNIIQCDDTVQGEFVGFLKQMFNQTVSPTDTIQQNAVMGDQLLEQIFQPQRYLAQMANVVAGMEGLKVWWQFNNQVMLTCGNNANYAGTIWEIFDQTHAWIMPPWIVRGIGPGGLNNGVKVITASYQMTKWDVWKTLQVVSTVPVTITLPLLSQVSPTDRFTIVTLSSLGSLVTVVPSGGATINGGASISLPATTYAKLSMETDGFQWYNA